MKRYLVLIVLILSSLACSCLAEEKIVEEPGIMITYSPELHTQNEILFRKYKFSLSEPTKIKLNFKSNIENKVSIKLIETDSEIPIKNFSKTILRRYSPYNIEADLAANNYTFLVYQHRPIGSTNNTGRYSFTISKVIKQQPVTEKVQTKTDDKINSSNNTSKNENLKVQNKDNTKSEEKVNNKEKINKENDKKQPYKTIFEVISEVLNFLANLIAILEFLRISSVTNLYNIIKNIIRIIKFTIM